MNLLLSPVTLPLKLFVNEFSCMYRKEKAMYCLFHGRALRGFKKCNNLCIKTLLMGIGKNLRIYLLTCNLTLMSIV